MGQAERYDRQFSDDAFGHGTHPRGLPMFRLIQRQGWIVDVTTTSQVGIALRTRKPGRYHADEISADPAQRRDGPGPVAVARTGTNPVVADADTGVTFPLCPRPSSRTASSDPSESAGSGRSVRHSGHDGSDGGFLKPCEPGRGVRRLFDEEAAGRRPAMCHGHQAHPGDAAMLQ
jgi:hypothetical protein